MESKHEILNLFGENVRKFRRLLNRSQKELAHKADLRRAYIGMIERAEKNITLANIEKIAHALEIKIEDLISISNGKKQIKPKSSNIAEDLQRTSTLLLD